MFLRFPDLVWWLISIVAWTRVQIFMGIDLCVWLFPDPCPMTQVLYWIKGESGLNISSHLFLPPDRGGDITGHLKLLLSYFPTTMDGFIHWNYKPNSIFSKVASCCVFGHRHMKTQKIHAENSGYRYDKPDHLALGPLEFFLFFP